MRREAKALILALLLVTSEAVHQQRTCMQHGGGLDQPAERPAPPAPGALTEEQYQHVLSDLTSAKQRNLAACLCTACKAKAAKVPVLGSSFTRKWLLLRNEFIQPGTCQRHWKKEPAGAAASDRDHAQYVSAERLLAKLQGYRNGSMDLDGKPITTAVQHTATPHPPHAHLRLAVMQHIAQQQQLVGAATAQADDAGVMHGGNAPGPCLGPETILHQQFLMMHARMQGHHLQQVTTTTC